MSAEILVKALDDALCNHQKSYVLPLSDLASVSSSGAYALVIPGSIDVTKFTGALARTLSRFPKFAGRLQAKNGPRSPWTIRLNNDGVPVSVVESRADHIVRSIAVVQSRLDFVQGVNVDAILVPSHSLPEPLARFTMTHFTLLGQTAIGFSWWTPLGDDRSIIRFLRTLSQLYQDGAVSDNVPAYHRPVVFHAQNSTAASSNCNRGRCLGSNVQECRDLPEQDLARVCFRLTQRQSTQLRNWIDLQASFNTERTQLSLQDCIVALIAVSLNRTNSNASVRDIGTIFDYRAVPDCGAPSSGHAIVLATTGLIEPNGRYDLYSFASAVRKSLHRVRNPTYLSACVSMAGSSYLKLAEELRGIDVEPLPGQMIVDSYLRSDRRNVHLGYPGKTQWFMKVPPMARFVHLTRSNPSSSPLSQNPQLASEDAIEVLLYLPFFLQNQFEGELQNTASTAGIMDAIEWVRN